MRTARNTLLTGLALAAPYIIGGLVLQGRYAGKLVWSGLVVLAGVVPAAGWLYARGRQADLEHDEREQSIVSDSARFAFFAFAVVLHGYYAWRFSIVGPDEPSFWLIAALWGSFAGAYVYNRATT